MRYLARVAWLCALLAVGQVFVTEVWAGYRPIKDGTSNRVIIFVHGLWGDPDTTFAAGSPHPNWFDIIRADTLQTRGQPPLSSYAIGLLTYPAGRGDQLSISEVASGLTRSLRDAGFIESKRELYFVAHSLGGLVIKELLLNARGNPDVKPLFDQTRAVFLVSTPTSGSEAADFIANKIPQFAAGRIVADLKSIGDNAFLQSLQVRWNEFMRSQPACGAVAYCAYETKPTLGLLVVPKQYSETYCVETPAAMNEDHISIVKPTSANAQIHVWLRGSLADASIRRAGQRRCGSEPPGQVHEVQPPPPPPQDPDQARCTNARGEWSAGYNCDGRHSSRPGPGCIPKPCNIDGRRVLPRG